MIRRYEQSDGSVTRFWELERRDDVSFTCRWGRVGSAGRNERNYGHPDAAASKSAADKLIAEKVKTGFSPIGKPKKIETPAKKRVVAKPAAAPDHAKLEAMLADNPDDAATWQVYADSLIQQGDAWGEVIAMAAAGKRPKTQQAEATKNLLKELDGSTLEWRFGTIEKASLCPEEEDSGNASDGDDDTSPYAATLARILKHPAGRLVRELELGLPPNDDVDWSYDSILPALTGNGVLPLLRVLDMTADAEFMDQDSWRAVGDLSKLWAVIPQIREIRLKGSGNDEESTQLGTVVAPHLEKFVHISSGLAKDVPIQLGKAVLPELRHLELYLGGEDYGNTCKVKSFAGIFDGKGLPRLEYLGIVNSEWERDLIAALAKAPIVKRLKTLDLTKGTMWREAAQALLEYASAFRHLELLDVSDNYFDTQMCAAIKKAIPCANVADQKTLDDPDDDEPYRYVTVGE